MNNPFITGNWPDDDLICVAQALDISLPHTHEAFKTDVLRLIALIADYQESK
jgi:hypothetical protein